MITTTMTSAPPVAPATQPDPEGAAPRGEKPVLIRLEQLTKVYTEGEREHIVLDELNREFYRGEFVCLLGKSCLLYTSPSPRDRTSPRMPSSA